MLGKPSFRKAVTGKRVKVVSHAGPSVRKRIGTIEDVTHGSTAIVRLEPIPWKIKKGDRSIGQHDRVIHKGLPSKLIVINVQGVVLASKQQ